MSRNRNGRKKSPPRLGLVASTFSGAKEIIPCDGEGCDSRICIKSSGKDCSRETAESLVVVNTPLQMFQKAL